jgi:cation transport regulator ChaB
MRKWTDFSATDFNPSHEPAGSSVGGRFASAQGGGGKGDTGKGRAFVAKVGEKLSKKYSKASELRNGTVYTSSVFDATRALYEGRKVNLTQPNETSTLIDHLGKVAARMIELGEKAPNFDLCKVAVSGSNLFCAESKGIPRAKMPQLDDDQTKAFIKQLGDKYGIEKTTEYAANLRATQNELNGARVAKNAARIKAGTDRGNPIIVSKDNYILDGHHRWAARAGLEAGKGDLMKTKMPVARANVGIIDLLEAAEKFTGGKGKKGVGDAWRFYFSDVYKSLKDLPGATKKLSHHKKRIWRAAFNSAHKQYKGDESKAFAVAWAAANKAKDAMAGRRQIAQDQDEDDITLTQAALLKLMEYGREDAKGDLDLHKALEHVAKKKLKKGCVESGDLEGLTDYDPDQERDKDGKWTSGPGKHAGKGNAPRKPEEVSKAQTRPFRWRSIKPGSSMEEAAQQHLAEYYRYERSGQAEIDRRADRERRAEADRKFKERTGVSAAEAWNAAATGKARRARKRDSDTSWMDPLVAFPAEQYDQIKPRGAQGSNSYGQEPGTIPLPTSGFGVREITSSGQINELKGPSGRPLIFSTEQEAAARAALLQSRTGLTYLAFRAD